MFSFDFDFRVRRPGGDVSRAVEQIWYARGTVPYRRELIAPTGSSVILLVLGDPIEQTPASGHSFSSDQGMIIGPHTAPVENAPHGETFALGIVTTSVGCQPVTGAPPAPLRGRVVGLEATERGLTDLRARLGRGSASDPELLLDLVQRHVESTVDLNVPGIERVERVIAMLEAHPRRPIADVADALGVTHAHLDREFNRVVGLTPRALARLLLLRRLLTDLDSNGEVSWASVALENGWSDQSHFSRDFKRHTGATPRHYLEIQRSIAASGGDGAGFTPDLDSLR